MAGRLTLGSLLALFVASMAPPLDGAAGDVPIVDVRAAMIGLFPKYVEWPESRFDKPEDPFVIGIVGDPELYQVVTEAARNHKKFGTHPIIVKYFDPPERAKVDPAWSACHVLYLSAASVTHADEITKFAKKHHILTISDAPDFLERGGCIQFVVVERRQRIKVSASNAKQSDLTVSSKLLRLAVKK